MDILLVGADPELIEQLGRAAMARNHALEAWPTPDAALEAHQRRPFDFIALVCSPATQGSIDGFEFCRRVRALPDGDLVHLLVMMPNGCADRAQEGLAAGASSCVLLPATPTELELRVRVAEWRVAEYAARAEIGRASCWERVCYVV